jgi:Cu-processing system permease protein
MIRFVMADILRNRTLIAYTLLLSALSWTTFSLEENTSKGVLTLLNVILFTVPLVSVVFSASYMYNSAEFIELLLGQPVTRKRIYNSLFCGLSISLVIAFLVGAGIPLLIFVPGTTGMMIAITGCCVSVVFVSIAFLCAILTRDKAKGIGLAILTWLYFSLLFDGIVLFLVFQFSEYPIENAMVAVSALSPVDLARILVLLHLDASALMGYTGAVFREFFGTTKGVAVTFALLGAWILVPFLAARGRFNKKDL